MVIGFQIFVSTGIHTNLNIIGRKKFPLSGRFYCSPEHDKILLFFSRNFLQNQGKSAALLCALRSDVLTFLPDDTLVLAVPRTFFCLFFRSLRCFLEGRFLSQSPCYNKNKMQNDYHPKINFCDTLHFLDDQTTGLCKIQKMVWEKSAFMKTRTQKYVIVATFHPPDAHRRGWALSMSQSV